MFVLDESFALPEDLLKTLILKELTNVRIIINSHLSQIWRFMENVFGISASIIKPFVSK